MASLMSSLPASKFAYVAAVYSATLVPNSTPCPPSRVLTTGGGIIAHSRTELSANTGRIASEKQCTAALLALYTGPNEYGTNARLDTTLTRAACFCLGR